MKIIYKERVYYIYSGGKVSFGQNNFKLEFSGYMRNYCTKLYYYYVLKENGKIGLGEILIFKEKQESIKLIKWKDYRPNVIYLSEDFSSILNSSDFSGRPVLVNHNTPELENEKYNLLMEIVKQITQAYA